MATLEKNTNSKRIAKVSFPRYGETEVIEVDVEGLKGKEIVKMAHSYPDLYTQASISISNIENVKTKMLNSITDLFSFEGAHIIHTHTP